MPSRISFAQNGEDVRLWHAFGPTSLHMKPSLTYVEVGANDPRRMSVTAALYDLGWRGLLIEADPALARELRRQRPGDVVVEAAAAARAGTVTFFRIPGTGLGTMDVSEADVARKRGFQVVESEVAARPLDDILAEFLSGSPSREVHALSLDVEGAETEVLSGLSLSHYRPWVLCVEAIEPGTSVQSHVSWEPSVVGCGYRYVAFDGVNRWYVAEERADLIVDPSAGAPAGTTIAEAIATPPNVIDRGIHGWVDDERARFIERDDRGFKRIAWQRQLLMHELAHEVPRSDYERQIHELRHALSQVEGSRTFRLSRVMARPVRKAQHVVHLMKAKLPSPITNRIIRERHLRHVAVNMSHLTDPAYLGNPPEDSVNWIASKASEEVLLRPPVPPGLELDGFPDPAAVRTWLNSHPFDSDIELDARMDNHDDEVGRTRAALRTRLRLQETPRTATKPEGGRVLVDARSLQSPAFGARGIGRFARAVLLAAREAVGDERVTLLVDRGLNRIPESVAGGCEQMTHVREGDAGNFGVVLQPSPMTHSVDPLLPVLASSAYRIAVVYDFIPLHYPSIYIRHPAARAEYAANLDALMLFDEYICISDLVRVEVADVRRRRGLDEGDARSVVAWPRDVVRQSETQRSTGGIDGEGPIVLMTGDEPRKNTFGGLAGIAAATTGQTERDVVVVGMAGQDVRVHHWSIAAAMRPGEVRTLGRVDDAELTRVLQSASCVVIPSFDEGLSLPVIEALSAGVPVVASDVPAHRELIGTGVFSCDPGNPRSIAKAVRRTRGRTSVHKQQVFRLARHAHANLEDVIIETVRSHVGSREGTPAPTSASTPTTVSPRSRISVGIATPWVPQRTGVADFSTTVITELADLADVTVYTTSDARVDAEGTQRPTIRHRSIADLLDDPSEVIEEHDAFITVLGNSHYHLPMVELLKSIDSIVVAHDTRMVEFYMALRGRGGVEQLMLTTLAPHAPGTISPALDDQIDDMRLLQNAGFWEIANRSEKLIMHSPTAAPRIASETGREPVVLPFATQRLPATSTLTESDRRDARQRLGFDRYPEGTIHLGSFGYVDPRTKMTDLVVESAAWLAQWGYPVALHLVGSSTRHQERELTESARRAGLDQFSITGFVSDDEFRAWLLAIDVGIQLRVSPLLGVSGPLSDLAAFGTPAVASRGLCVDVGTPAYIHSLPDEISPVGVSEAVEALLKNPMPHADREALRLAYLAEKSPRRYAEQLLAVIAP